jgi:multiple sugar transport system permease protein
MRARRPSLFGRFALDPEHPVKPSAWGTVLFLGLLTLLAVLTLVPLYWMVVTAFTPPTLAVRFPPELIPSSPTLRNFQAALSRPMFVQWAINSTIMATVVTVFTVLTASMAGYAFAKIPFAGSKWLFWVFIVSVMLPFETILVPLFILITRMGLVDSYAGLILPLLASPFGVFLMKQFIQTLPSELMDSARVDGANEWQIFWHVVTPLVTAGMAFLAIITFVAQWNLFLWPLVATRSSSMRTLQVGLVLMREEEPLYFGLHMAGAVLAAIPIVIVFFAFQRYFLRGITVGAVKG